MSNYTSEKDTPGWKIFHWLFECELPAVYAESHHEIQHLGTVTTGDLAMDIQWANDIRRCAKPISQMAALSAKGVDVILTNYKVDAEKIYNLIQAHLKDWAGRINNEVNSPLTRGEDFDERMSRVLDDLETLDNFANKVYPIARAALPREYAPNSILSRLRAITRSTMPIAEVTRPTVSTEAPSAFTEALSTKAKDRIRKWQS